MKSSKIVYQSRPFLQMSPFDDQVKGFLDVGVISSSLRLTAALVEKTQSTISPHVIPCTRHPLPECRLAITPNQVRIRTVRDNSTLLM
jgi:hypothetical protein